MSVLPGSASQLQIYCIINGEDVPFSVKIESDETVDTLKKVIRGKRMHRLASFEASELNLYHIDIPDDDDLVGNASRQSQTKPVLKVTTQLASVSRMV